jgi:hypothetical protein
VSFLKARILLGTALLLGASMSIQASDSLSAQPGYVDFGDLSAISANEPAVEISLGGALLRFLAAAIANEDQELADTLGKLRSIRISVFELQPEDLTDATARAIAISKQLEADGWEGAVVVNSKDSLIRMYMKTHKDRVAGMTVMVIEPESDAVFINIVGEIDPAQLGRITNNFGVSLEDLTGDKEE